MVPVTWPEVLLHHPFSPKDQMVPEGYHEMFDDLTKDLSDITVFHTVSLQR